MTFPISEQTTGIPPIPEEKSPKKTGLSSIYHLLLSVPNQKRHLLNELRTVKMLSYLPSFGL